MDGDVLFVPKAKSGRSFSLPLPKIVVDALAEAKELNATLESEFAFPSPTSKSGHIELPREDTLFTRDQLAAQPDLILVHINDKKARFTRIDILRGLSEYISDPLTLRVASDQVFASSKLVRIDRGTNEEFTTQDFLEVEQGLSGCTAEMARSGGFQVKP